MGEPPMDGLPQMGGPLAIAPEMPQAPVTPDLIMGATGKLVAAGRLPQATDTLTPEVIQALTEVANEAAPGLYDLSNPQDLAEVIHDAALGTIPVGPRPVRSPGPGLGGPGPVGPSGGPLPGPVPGGGPGGPLG